MDGGTYRCEYCSTGNAGEEDYGRLARGHRWLNSSTSEVFSVAIID